MLHELWEITCLVVAATLGMGLGLIGLALIAKAVGVL